MFGFGSFGRLVAKACSENGISPVVFDPRARDSLLPGVRWGSASEAAACDVLILAVPAQDLRKACTEAAPHVRPGTLVADVCSVKIGPCEIMARTLPAHCQILGTHPLFGPQSAARGIAGLSIALCPVRVDSERLEKIRSFLADNLQLAVHEVSPEEHDRLMARVQVLTHFLGHAAAALGLPDTPLATLAYTRLLQIRDNIRDDSEALFRTIQCENPFAAETRRALLDALAELDRRITGV